MGHITKHNSKEEGESYSCEQSRIYFSVARYTVGINDLLKGPREFISLEIGRGVEGFCNCGGNLSVMLVLVRSVELVENIIDPSLIASGNPAVPLKHGIIYFEHVHGMVNSLFLKHV